MSGKRAHYDKVNHEIEQRQLARREKIQKTFIAYLEKRYYGKVINDAMRKFLRRIDLSQIIGGKMVFETSFSKEELSRLMNNSIEIHNREVQSVNHLMVDGTEHKAGDDDDAR